jgi:hypothetical protein
MLILLLPWHLGQCQGNLTEGGRISTVDLLVLTNLDQLIFILKEYLSLLKNCFLCLGKVYCVFPFIKASLVMVVTPPKEQRNHSRTKKINNAIRYFVKFQNDGIFIYFSFLKNFRLSIFKIKRSFLPNLSTAKYFFQLINIIGY